MIQKRGILNKWFSCKLLYSINIIPFVSFVFFLKHDCSIKCVMLFCILLEVLYEKYCIK